MKTVDSTSMFSMNDFQNASELIKGKVLRTPLIYSPTFSKMTGAQIYLKLENLQETGSFKLRGATYKVLSHLDEYDSRSVVAASAGNHAQGVALAARRAGLRATIVMPEWASISKQQATAGYGGEVILEGQNLGESILKARQLAEEGMVFIHPFDDRDIILGQSTIALEIFEDLKDPDVIIVPVGGGGLVSGIASAAKAISPGTQIIGVQAAACPSAYMACQEQKIIQTESKRSLADGIAVKQIGNLNYSIIREKVDNIVLVDEDQISAGILILLERKRVLAEGAGAAPLAALLSGSLPIKRGSRVVLVISGGNVDSPLLDRVIRQGLFRNDRIVRFSVLLDDIPGSLARLLLLIAESKANVLHIYHDRSGRELPFYLSRVELELEARGSEHVKEICSKLIRGGYNIHSQLHGNRSA